MHAITKAFLFLGSAIYLFFLFKRTLKHKLDLFDLIYLVAVVAVPCFFALAEIFSQQFAQMIGIQYPFVLMFGLIHGVTYLHTTLQAGEILKLKQKQMKLIQEVSLLKESLNRDVTDQIN